MAKKKDVKPLLATKHDFVASLDVLIETLTFGTTLIDTVLSVCKIDDVAREKLTLYRDRLDAALFTHDN